ncbi:TIGR03279 family radical SAM protein [Synechococcus sp. CS-1324]|uniref:TIGR03279 family radical SAM protein n=1 Tax=unclassified Synechococcus TaxID=2626047 RepID=UPI000DB61DFD|nr:MULTISPECIES: TIGR03279 family radical SAM protein [unclassified Synechococcus]MCT0212204.1 TIGR03279 family radical SAM protein [Synechococcus sp. CS-1326]MCT0230469.1 TIGR03279 family radical SAM protein [Synechococcus sp. CS-1324]MCT0233401.1 TIGR03279 family radical SAM protein [Synechococcus sp. CS-1327]PZV03333.1 MAG: TIGR03279 family radical SAM protein [Cyanobium sp.]
MWNEPSAGVSLDVGAVDRLPQPAVVSTVAPGSIGEELGFQPGDRLLSINGLRPRDLIDLQVLVGEEDLVLEVEDPEGVLHRLEIEKDADDGLGLGFTEALFDGLRQCNNHCAFCFIDQQPPGQRESLYVKDDDFRLSFLYGSYLTLTNLTPADWGRIEDQRLSPLFVSVHATDPELRQRLLVNQRAGLLMEQLAWFAERRLQIHAQVVVCPGLNDGAALERSLHDLASFAAEPWPAVLSAAVVPVGLTRFRPQQDGLVPVDRDCARTVIAQVEPIQEHFLSRLGSRFAWLSDEWYLIAGLPLPPRSAYEDLPQQENGVGSIRAFLESLERATEPLPERLAAPRRISWVVGRLVAEALQPVVDRLNRVDGLEVILHGLPSPYWGQDQVVTGLLTGSDLLTGLAGLDLGDQLLLPSVVLRQGMPVFLDDLSLDAFRARCPVPIRLVDGADDFVAACIGELAFVP